MDAAVQGRYRPDLAGLADEADVLLLAGDLTRYGTVDEARCVAAEFGDLPVPVVAVLGNHDHHSDQSAAVAETLVEAGLRVLDGDGVVLDCAGQRLGVAGVKGFGGGFGSHTASGFGEPEMRAFVGHSVSAAHALGAALRSLDCDVLVALTHYAPVAATLLGEPPDIYPFLGTHLLGAAIDSAPTALAVHGHAHAGTELGSTPGGVPVRNVAYPVIRHAYRVYEVDAAGA